MLAAALPVTLELAVLSLAVAIVIGVGAGVLAAVRQGRPAEWAANAVALLGLSVPNFWLGLILILYLAVGAGLFPASGYVPFTEDPLANLHHLVLPALVLGTGLAAVVMRQTRSSMLEQLGHDFVRTHRAKGLAERTVVYGRVFRTALIPIVSLAGLRLGWLVGYSLIVETIFQWPGMGLLFIQSVGSADIPVMAAYLMLIALVFVAINLVVDLLYYAVDPRLRADRGAAAGRA